MARIQNILAWIATGGLIGAPVAMVTGCKQCLGLERWEPLGPNILAFLGLAVGVVLLALRLVRQRIPSIALFHDLIVLLSALCGVSLLTAGASVGAHPCLLCLVFWSCMGVLLVEIAFSETRLARWVAPSVLISGICGLLVLTLDDSRLALAAVVPPPKIKFGPDAGDPVPRPLPQDGTIAFATRCSVCAATTLKRVVSALRNKGEAVALVTLEGATTVNSSFPGWHPLVLPTSSYKALSIDPAGGPVLVCVRAGRVVWSRTAASMEVTN